MKNKIDKRMNMSIWPKFFPLLVDTNASLELTLDEFVEFLVTTARIAEIDRVDTNAALASQFVHAPNEPLAAFAPAPPPTATRGGILNLFRGAAETAGGADVNMTAFRKNCRRVLQHYTLTSTTSSEFRVSDVVACMVYLSKVPKYKSLYMLLESTMAEDYECVPNVSPNEAQQLVQLLKSLLDMPSSTIDFTNVKLLKNTLGRVMHYPITKFPKVMLMQGTKLARDKRCTIEELIVERGETISKLEPQCTNGQDSKIPYCEDSEFMDELVRLMDDFSLQRMFYNAANSIFYTAMENYAVANCKFVPDDYNNIFKSMDNIREFSESTSLQNFKSDSLNILLGGPTSSKRKKY